MKLPVISGYDTVKALRKVGFIVIRQKGSHIRLKKISGGRGHKVNNSSLCYTEEKNIKDAGLNLNGFIKLL